MSEYKGTDIVSGLQNEGEKEDFGNTGRACKTNRLDLYYQWKEGRIAKEEYAIRKDELTKELVDELQIHL